MKFSILVPAYNEERSISSCLNSLTSLTYDGKEIIVIDDASTDGTVQSVEGFLDKGVILVRREKNGGRAAALNSGLQKVTGDVVITTDADTVVPVDWLQRFQSPFEQQGAIAVGGAYQARNKDKPLVNATSVLDQILNGVFKKSLVPNKLSGVNSAVRRDALLNLGGFNENSWWSEDSELGWKLSRIGKVVYDPNNIVSTQYPDTWPGIWKRKFYWGYAMGLKFREQLPFNIKLWIRPIIFMALFISLFAFLATVPYGIRVYFVPGLIFLLLLSLLTLLYVPLGAIVMARTGNSASLKTLPVLAVLPLVREFAYVYGLCLGFYKGRVGSIRPSWKEKINHKDTERTEKKIVI
ncbi:MAG: glycosyltransferase family 2 protein [Candidatus Brocadia sp.]|nr:glycosyltransferase family 2 protein [Candidatus Brocadia sp.]